MEILDELFAATRMSGSISVMLLKLCLYTSLNIVRKLSSTVHSFLSIVGGSLACGIVTLSILGTSVHFMSLGAGIGFPCRQSFLWLSRVALHLCNQKWSRELSISLGLRARNISGDVTHVGSDAGSITLELVEFELLCAYTHIAMDSP